MTEGIDLGDGFGPFIPDVLCGVEDFDIIILEKEQMPGGDALKHKAREEYQTSIKGDHESELKEEKKALQKQLGKMKTQTRVASVRKAVHQQREQIKSRIALIDDEISDIHTVKARNNPQKYFGQPPPKSRGFGTTRNPKRPPVPEPKPLESEVDPKADPTPYQGADYGLMRHFA
jgi:hypothetical protein